MSSAHLIVVRHLWVLRRGRPWGLLVEGIFEPFLYLLSIGVGVGQLVVAGPELTRYAAFVAPGLLATSAMNSAVNETTNSFWWRVRFEKLYDAIVTTPMRVSDIAAGEIAASTLRSGLSSTCAEVTDKTSEQVLRGSGQSFGLPRRMGTARIVRPKRV